MRLLIADDEENLAHALKAVLEDAGYNCDVCFDGRKGDAPICRCHNC